MENSRCVEIELLLNQLEELVEESKSGFLSSRVAIDKEEVLDIIRDIRLKLPTEVKHSMWIVEERNKILSEAQEEAAVIIQEANEQVENMITKHEIMQFARERAEEIVESAREDAKEMHRGAVDYAQATCKDVELRLKRTLEAIHQEVQDFEGYITDMLREVYDNRQELKELSNRIDLEEA